MPSADPQIDSTTNEHQQDQPVREITQTDRLNQRLLLSFQRRLNEGGMQINVANDSQEQTNSQENKQDFDT
uniref:Uncharacterized protein n=1 Tax=Corethrella appendiculata TaxID=1370023 RepID=U5ENM5_9DIPT